jgi:biopolymer transport protein ExbD
VYEHAVRHSAAVVAVVMLACATKTEQSQPPPPPRPVVPDAAVAAAPGSSLAPCVVRVELTAGRVTLTGGGISGSDVTALRKVAKKCAVWLAADDNVTFEDVTKLVGLVAEQGIDEVHLGQPLGQWMSMDLDRVTKLWKAEPAAKVIAALTEGGPRLGADHAWVVEQVKSTVARARLDQPLGKQTADRGLFEAIASIVGLRRATVPVAIDLLERDVMPALQIDATAAVSPPSQAEVAKPQTGVELFELFVARASKRTAVKGLLGAIPDADVSTPYADDKAIEIRDGDWVVVATAPLAARLKSYDQRKLVAQYDRFVARSTLRDDDRVLVETSAHALADLAACVATVVQNRDALVFRVLPPPPMVELPRAGDGRKLPTVVITKTGISVAGGPAGGSVLASLGQTGPRTIVIEADRSLSYGRIRAVAAAIGTPGDVTFVLRQR